MISRTKTKSKIFSKILFVFLLILIILPINVGAVTDRTSGMTDQEVTNSIKSLAQQDGGGLSDDVLNSLTIAESRSLISGYGEDVERGYGEDAAVANLKSNITELYNGKINGTNTTVDEIIDNQSAQTDKSIEEKEEAREWFGLGGKFDSLIDDLFTGIAEFFIWLGGIILWVGGTLFEFIFSETLLKMSSYIEEIDALTTTWQAFRDIANLVFIFVLLAIAVGFILDYQPLGSKKLLARLIIIAILLNFSFFFTGIVIDTSNILAVSFYEKLEMEGEDGIYGAFTNRLYLNALFAPTEGVDDNVLAEISGDRVAKLLFGLLSFILLTIVGIIFFTAAFMFLTRFIVLLIVLMLSPIAFVSWILPKFDGIWKSWSNALVGQAFFAPVFLIMIWVVFNVMGDGLTWNDVTYDGTNANGVETVSYAHIVAGTDDKDALMGLILNFLVVMGLAIASLIIAKKVSASAGSGVGTLNKYVTSAGTGIVGLAGRRSVGLGRAVANAGGEKSISQRLANAERGGSRLAGGLRSIGATAQRSSFEAGRTRFGQMLGLENTTRGAGGEVARREAAAIREKERIDRITEPTEYEKAEKERAQERLDRIGNIEENLQSDAAYVQAQDDLTKSTEKLAEQRTELAAIKGELSTAKVRGAGASEINAIKARLATAQTEANTTKGLVDGHKTARDTARDSIISRATSGTFTTNKALQAEKRAANLAIARVNSVRNNQRLHELSEIERSIIPVLRNRLNTGSVARRARELSRGNRGGGNTGAAS